LSPNSEEIQILRSAKTCVSDLIGVNKKFSLICRLALFLIHGMQSEVGIKFIGSSFGQSQTRNIQIRKTLNFQSF
jgi:hypothetical protein